MSGLGALTAKMKYLNFLLAVLMPVNLSSKGRSLLYQWSILRVHKFTAL